MAAPVPENHPIRKFFTGLTYRNFSIQLGWSDIPVSEYIANILVDFIHVENLFKIRNQKGVAIQTVGEMLLEADVRFNAGSMERERDVHRHIGDFTLFMVGIFPEYLRRIRTRGMIHHPDFLIDYMRVGRQSYRNVSELEGESGRESMLMFRKLADNFELCVVGLGSVRDDLERRSSDVLERAKNILLN